MSREGFRRDPSGMRDLERSSMVGNAMEKIAQEIASRANAEGTANYRARQVQDPGGRTNSLRAAAEVYTDRVGGPDAVDRKLISVSYAYRVRGFGDG